jgi:adenosylcobinamide-phosphate synthase
MTVQRDARQTESPNAGFPMAAMAGLLGVRLSKAGQYALGDAKRPLKPGTVDQAWGLARAASVLALLLTAAWVHGHG